MVLHRQTMMAEMLEMGLDPMAEMRALGYEFRDGCMREVGGNNPFAFQGREHYDALAEAVSQYVPLLLEEDANLNPLWLPLGVSPGEGCPIFVSEGFEEAERLLLVIQGTGKVRAGIWGCALCINDSLEHGTMLPFLRRAAASGYGVVVLNPNENVADGTPIPGLENFGNHVAYVLDNIVPKCAAGHIDILAHSHGGRALLSYLSRAGSNNPAMKLVKRIHRLVFTDSYHVQTQLAYLPDRVRAILSDSTRAVNFVTDKSPLGTLVEEWRSQEYTFCAVEKGCLCLSAGVTDHASTNYAAMSAIFEFFEAGSPIALQALHTLQIDGTDFLRGLNDVRFGLPTPENVDNQLDNEMHEDDWREDNPVVEHAFQNALVETIGEHNTHEDTWCEDNPVVDPNFKHVSVAANNKHKDNRISRWSKLKHFLPSTKASSILLKAMPTKSSTKVVSL